LARILDARFEKIEEKKQIVGLTINEIRVKDGWADMIILYPKNPAILAHLPHHHGCNRLSSARRPTSSRSIP
jgi:hypothetical protein